MRTIPRLGSVNAALIALYFAPVWGGDGVRALISPFHGFEDRVHAVAAGYYRELLDFGLNGLMYTADVLAALKFVIGIGFLAYLIDFARALAVGRDANRETLDLVLVLASVAFMLWAWPALGSGDPALIRLHATQFLLLSGAMILIVIERHVEESEMGKSEVMAAAPQVAAAA